MKSFTSALLLASLVVANPVELVKRAAQPSDICFVAQTKGSVCAKQGSLKTPKVLRTINVGSADDCVSAVHVAPRALSGKFTQGDGPTSQCTLYTANLTTQGFTTANPVPFALFFDKACLQCRPCALGFKNGGFDTGALTPWTTQGNSQFQILAPGATNTEFAAFDRLNTTSQDSDGTTFQQALLQQTFEVCKGTKYNIAALVRGVHTSTVPANSTYTVRLGISNEGPTGPLVAISNGNFTGNYQEIDLTYTPTQRSAALFFASQLQEVVQAQSVFGVTIDNIKFTAA